MILNQQKAITWTFLVTTATILHLLNNPMSESISSFKNEILG